LAVAFAVTGTFDRVLGVDVSERALQDGALRLQKEIEDYPGEKEELAPLDFRASDGLQAATVGEADTVCIAGMGVNTMICILTAENDSQEALLDVLQSKRLIVQPTNSRPRNLLLLYSALKEMGWNAKDERIEYLSSRWYLSTLFTRSNQRKTKDTGMLLPGALLAGLNEENRAMRNVFSDYVEHHCAWIERDKKIPGGKVSRGDEFWLENFSNYSKRRVPREK
jgi:tRNA A22 N-methylase